MLLHGQYTFDESCYYLQIFALLMPIDYIPRFHGISQFFCTVSPKCQGADVILFWLNFTKNYKEKRKGQEWEPPPLAVLLIRSIKFLCLIDYQDWDRNFSCPFEFEMIFTLKVHGLHFLYCHYLIMLVTFTLLYLV